MNFFVISDIHGSSKALKEALEIYKTGNYNNIIICGDILYHGARNPLPEGHNPKEVIELLNSLKEELIVVRGNCESEVDAMVLEFPILGDYSHLYNGDRQMFITHGHKFSEENLPPLKKGSLFLYGHTHLPVAKEENGIFILNPGSISLPKGGFKASFGTLSENSWKVIELDSKKVLIEVNFS